MRSRAGGDGVGHLKRAAGAVARRYRAIRLFVDVTAVRFLANVLVRERPIRRHLDGQLPDRVVVRAHDWRHVNVAGSQCRRVTQDEDVLAKIGLRIAIERHRGDTRRLEVRAKSRNRPRGAQADRRRRGRIAVGCRIRGGVRAGKVAEVGRLVHVDPKGIDVDAVGGVKEGRELAIPKLLCLGCEPVRERRRPRPDDTLVDGAIRELQESVGGDAVVER